MFECSVRKSYVSFLQPFASWCVGMSTATSYLLSLLSLDSLPQNPTAGAFLVLFLLGTRVKLRRSCKLTRRKRMSPQCSFESNEPESTKTFLEALSLNYETNQEASFWWCWCIFGPKCAGSLTFDCLLNQKSLQRSSPPPLFMSSSWSACPPKACKKLILVSY